MQTDIDKLIKSTRRKLKLHTTVDDEKAMLRERLKQLKEMKRLQHTRKSVQSSLQIPA